ncbi:MAG: ORF6N domain-containing protein [Coriobacteriia bacterium]|nr:ORF6N domain-containing protein [Coriobacteriia bacterium]
MTDGTALMPVEAAELRIRVVRDTRVILDADLAVLYGVETRMLVQAVRRNPDRFPSDFMFELTLDEWAALRSAASAMDGWGGRRTPPLAFTEQGIAMLSSVLRSPRAVAVNVQIMRAFVRLREILAENADLSRRLDDLEQRYDDQFKIIIQAIQALTAPPVRPRNPVGFRP